MPAYTEDHLVEQPAIQLMEHELNWEGVNCYDEWSSGVSNEGRDGKREVVLTGRLKPALQRLNPDLPVEAIEGAVEEICRDFFLTALTLAEANREIVKLRRPSSWVLFAPVPHRKCNLLIINEFLFEWISQVGETDQIAACGIPDFRVFGIHEDDH